MNIFLVAHGTTVENERNIHQGWGTDSHLSKQGMLETKLLSKALKDEVLDYAIVSPLERCIETYKAIALYHPNLIFELSDGVRAKKSGIYEGKTRQIWTKDSTESGIPIHKFKPTGGESTEDQQHRVVEYFNNYMLKLNYSNLLVVTHGGVIVTLGLYLRNLPFDDYIKIHPPKASISKLEFCAGKLKVLQWGNTKHLYH